MPDDRYFIAEGKTNPQEMVDELEEKIALASVIGWGQEQRITSETGGEKGRKITEIGFLDPVALEMAGRVAGFGAQKYASFNFLKGYNWSLSYNALLRHLMAFMRGEDIDSESGMPHIAHAAWQALALCSFWQRNIGTDDRPPKFLYEKEEDNE